MKPCLRCNPIVVTMTGIIDEIRSDNIDPRVPRDVVGARSYTAYASIPDCRACDGGRVRLNLTREQFDAIEKTYAVGKRPTITLRVEVSE